MNMNDYKKVTDRIQPSERCREEVLAMSRKKNDINNSKPKENYIEVSGVEQYRRHKLYKAVSVAAAAVIVTGGIGGSLVLISRNGSSPMYEVELSDEESELPEEPAASIDESTTEAEIQEETEPVTEEETDPKKIAEDLIAADRDLLFKLHAGTFEVDKSAAVERTIVNSDEFGDYEYHHMFYPVTDPEYKTWEDVEKRCFEIYDTEFGNVVLENALCRDDGDFLEYETFFFRTENGFYVRDDIHDDSRGVRSWADEMPEPEITEEGNIVVTRIEDLDGGIFINVTYTIGNTENGWRILRADEQIIEKDD